MFGFIEKIVSFGKSLVSNSKIKWVSLKNYLCYTRTTLVKINSDETLLY